jgi:hypothetical protein
MTVVNNSLIPEQTFYYGKALHICSEKKENQNLYLPDGRVFKFIDNFNVELLNNKGIIVPNDFNDDDIFSSCGKNYSFLSGKIELLETNISNVYKFYY